MRALILLLTHRSGFEADFVIDVLRERHVPFVRFNQDDYPTNLPTTARLCETNFDGVLKKREMVLPLGDIQVAWCHQLRKPVCEASLSKDVAQMVTTESEAFLAGLWQSVSWKWINHPRAITLASNKLYQLQFAKQLGFTIPETLVTNDQEEALAFLDEYDQVIIKDMATQTFHYAGQIYVSYTRRLAKDELLTRGIRGGVPICLQQYIVKYREIRATVVGEKVFAVTIDSQNEQETLDDYRRGDLEIGEKYVATRLPLAVEQLCVTLVRQLGLEYGAIDLILTPEGSYVFLEVNTTGAWVWAEKLTGLPITAAIADLLISRLDTPPVRARDLVANQE